MVTRWLVLIRLFDYEAKHVAGVRNGAADAISRRPATKEDLEDRMKEVEIGVPQSQAGLRLTTMPLRKTMARLDLRMAT
jgi:hypothetical protein